MIRNPLRLRRLALIGLPLALAGALAFVAVRTGPLAPVRVTVMRVQLGSLSPTLFGIGTVEARRSWMVGPTAAGRVLGVAVDVGDRVKAGQLLAEMDPVDLDERLIALEASILRAASAQAAAQAQLADASARRALADSSMRRNRELANQNFISPGALEARLQEMVSADAVRDVALANVTGAGLDQARLRAEQTGLVQLRASLRLRAPADGVVVSRDAEAGTTLVAGQPVLRLIDPASLWVKLRIDQSRSAGLTTGLKASIVLRSQPDLPVTGQVARLELLADNVTEERIAQVAFDPLPALVMPSAGDAVRPPLRASVGEMAEVTLLLPATKRLPWVPNASIQRYEGQAGVWQPQSGKVVFTPVQLGGRSLDGRVQVLQGLAEGDEVVVYSQKALSPASRVQVVDALVSGDGAAVTP
jgi:HlyD family secretion protein